MEHSGSRNSSRIFPIIAKAVSPESGWSRKTSPATAEELEVQLARPLPIPLRKARVIAETSLGTMLATTEMIPAPHRHEGKCERVVAGEEAELVAAEDDVLGHLLQVAGGLLHPTMLG